MVILFKPQQVGLGIVSTMQGWSDADARRIARESRKAKGSEKERRSTWLRRLSEGQGDPANEASPPRRQVTDHVRRVLGSR